MISFRRFKKIINRLAAQKNEAKVLEAMKDPDFASQAYTKFKSQYPRHTWRDETHFYDWAAINWFDVLLLILQLIPLFFGENHELARPTGPSVGTVPGGPGS